MKLPSPVPPELQGLSNEELRFYRLIDEREMEPDGTQVVTLACGHTTVQIVPIPDTIQYKQCAQCINKWVEAQRSRPDGS